MTTPTLTLGPSAHWFVREMAQHKGVSDDVAVECILEMIAREQLLFILGGGLDGTDAFAPILRVSDDDRHYG